jgi:hypothetical protein
MNDPGNTSMPALRTTSRERDPRRPRITPESGRSLEGRVIRGELQDLNQTWKRFEPAWSG